MEVTAKARYIRMSVRKVRLVVDVVRGMQADRALAQLRFMKKAAALPVSKVIASAVANAEHNLGLDRSNLVVKTITADGGPILYRWHPRAFGRSAPIRKRTAHITVILSEREPSAKKTESSDAAPVAKKAPAKKAAAKKTVAKKAPAKKKASNA